MSNPYSSATGDGDGDGDDKSGIDAIVAKTAGFVVFSGIAMSILKALNPYKNNKIENSKNERISPVTESAQPIQEPKFVPPQEEPIIIKKPTICTDKFEPEPSSLKKTVEIVKGDTLWGLSRKHGVTIDDIKEANGLTGDTIYAGKKLVTIDDIKEANGLTGDTIYAGKKLVIP